MFQLIRLESRMLDPEEMLSIMQFKPSFPRWEN